MMSDPMGLLGGLNSYGYVDANPLIRTDPNPNISSAPEKYSQAADETQQYRQY